MERSTCASSTENKECLLSNTPAWVLENSMINQFMITVEAEAFFIINTAKIPERWIMNIYAASLLCINAHKCIFSRVTCLLTVGIPACSYKKKRFFLCAPFLVYRHSFYPSWNPAWFNLKSPFSTFPEFLLVLCFYIPGSLWGEYTFLGCSSNVCWQ